MRGQLDPFRDHGRIAGPDGMLTAFDFEPSAFAHVPRGVYGFMMGSADDESTFLRNRRAFDCVSLVPRGVADVSSIDTSTELFGQKMKFPILVAPTSAQGPLYPEGEMGMHKGAAAANTTMIVSSGSSYPIDKIAAASPGPPWFQLYRLDTIEDTLERVGRAEAAGCKAVAFTVDGPFAPYRERVLHDRHLGGTGEGEAALADGGFRRGTDVLAALALGARAVMVTCAALWGLVAHGADGVKTVREMLQSETARDMALCGKRNLSSIDRTLVKIHRF